MEGDVDGGAKSATENVLLSGGIDASVQDGEFEARSEGRRVRPFVLGVLAERREGISDGFAIGEASLSKGADRFLIKFTKVEEDFRDGGMISDDGGENEAIIGWEGFVEYLKASAFGIVHKALKRF